MKLLRTQKRTSASILKCSKKRVIFDAERLEDIREAITKEDIRELVKEGAIIKLPKKGVSRARAREHIKQKRKGRRHGPGSKEGTRGARLPFKREWINNVRAQRGLLFKLRDKGVLSKENFKMVYYLIKGGFFRSRRHIRLHLKERGMLK